MTNLGSTTEHLFLRIDVDSVSTISNRNRSLHIPTQIISIHFVKERGQSIRPVEPMHSTAISASVKSFFSKPRFKPPNQIPQNHNKDQQTSTKNAINPHRTLPKPTHLNPVSPEEPCILHHPFYSSRINSILVSFLFSSRVGLIVNTGQVLEIQVRIYLSSTDVAMP